MNAAVDRPTQPVPASDSAEVAVRLSQVSKRFPGVAALADIDLAIPRGSITGLLGLNGSGKSTLLKLMAGLCRPTTGQVLVEGRTPNRQTKARIAYSPEIDHLYPWMTVGEMLNFLAPFYADWDRERAAALLDFMAIPAQQRVDRLSKGMRARLRLVIALARPASLLLLDEPLSGIDPPSRSKIVAALLAEFRAEEQTVILSTHEVLETETLFDRVLLLEQGRVRLDGEAESLRATYGCAIHDLLKEVLP